MLESQGFFLKPEVRQIFGQESSSTVHVFNFIPFSFFSFFSLTLPLPLCLWLSHMLTNSLLLCAWSSVTFYRQNYVSDVRRMLYVFIACPSREVGKRGCGNTNIWLTLPPRSPKIVKYTVRHFVIALYSPIVCDGFARDLSIHRPFILAVGFVRIMSRVESFVYTFELDAQIMSQFCVDNVNPNLSIGWFFLLGQREGVIIRRCRRNVTPIWRYV